MKKVPRILVILPALALTFGLAAPVWARSGADDSPNASTPLHETTSGSGSSGSASSSSAKSTTETGNTETKTETEVHSTSSSESEVQKHNGERGKDLLKAAKKDVKKERSQEDRKKSCDTRKTGLENKLANINKNAETYQKHVDEVFAKAEAYQKNNNITVANWDSLVASATTAQANAKASVEALNKLNVTVNCDDANVAGNVATFKAAAEQTRDSLKAYKTAVKNLLTALNSAKEGNN